MKLKRTICTACAAVIAAVSMTVCADAATQAEIETVVKTAGDAGIRGYYVQNLDNFLSSNASYFTTEDCEKMIEVMNEGAERFSIPLAKEIYNKTPAELTENEKLKLQGHLSSESERIIYNVFLNLAHSMGIGVTITKTPWLEVTAVITGERQDREISWDYEDAFYDIPISNTGGRPALDDTIPETDTTEWADDATATTDNSGTDASESKADTSKAPADTAAGTNTNVKPSKMVIDKPISQTGSDADSTAAFAAAAVLTAASVFGISFITKKNKDK